jgi:phage major head subunit gpT-like protein
LIRAVIFQRRTPFKVIPQFSMTDPAVFFGNEFRWGVDGRCNVGFGIWQVGFMSTQPLTIENVRAAIAQMESYHRPDGTPLGITADMLVTGTANYPDARTLSEDNMVPNTLSNLYESSTTITQVPNTVRGLFTPVKNLWLN